LQLKAAEQQEVNEAKVNEVNEGSAQASSHAIHCTIACTASLAAISAQRAV